MSTTPRMRRWTTPVLLVAALASALRLHAVNPGPAALPRDAWPVAGPCDTPGHRQFDFWVGEWTVTTSAGRPAGRNHIARVHGGCALSEQWVGASRTTGSSLSAYSPETGTWHQTWVDSDGLLLRLDGRLEGTCMVLRGRTVARGRATLHRITWTPESGARVRQHWETSADGGATWRTEFEGVYARR